MAESLENVFEVVIGNMQQTLQEMKGGEGMDNLNCEFNLEDFWLKLRDATKCISNEVTKLCLAFSKPPLPSVTEIIGMLKILETAYLDMLSTFYTLPKYCGLMLRKEVNMAVSQIMDSLFAVFMSLQEKGDKAQKNRLMLTGRVWDACEAMESLPQNNFQVTCKIMQREEGLVLDAVQEIEEEVTTDQSDNNRTWSHKDRVLLFPCMGLVKTARSSLKKIGVAVRIKGKFETEEQVSQLDDLMSGVQKVSPAVDDLVTSLYPPINKVAVKSAADVLKTEIHALLNMVKQSHYTNDEDNGWIEFLLNAVDHNNNKLQPLLVS